MVLAELVGSAALGASGIWSYNRKNFMYDREMRQHQEYQVIEMRCRQTDLWREDIRDMVGLTEKKMDSYMVVNALLLGFTVALFAEGRLEPGTPEWLLWLYIVSLAGAFMMLLSSVWFAMHASVVAQCNAVRLLTQLVRPPIPTWEHLEACRTYGHAFEGVPAANMMRLPMLQTLSEGDNFAPVGNSAADPWGLERRGEDIYELQKRPITDGRHTRLVRQAMKQWQAYDAFARVAMTLGTILLCFALSYYALGYILVQDGSPWAAWVAVCIFMGIATTLLRLDLSLRGKEKARVQLLLVGGPVCASVAAAEWTLYRSSTQVVASALSPWAFLLHCAFIMDFLHLCRVVRQPGGSLLPTRFRSVLYIDIFGWLIRRQPLRPRPPPKDPYHRSKDRGSYQPVLVEAPAEDREESEEELEEKSHQGQAQTQSLRRRRQAQQVSRVLQQTLNKESIRGQFPESSLSERFQEVSPDPWPGQAVGALTAQCCPGNSKPAPEWVRATTFSDYGQRMPYYVHVHTGEVRHELPDSAQCFMPSLSFTAEQLEELGGLGTPVNQAQSCCDLESCLPCRDEETSPSTEARTFGRGESSGSKPPQQDAGLPSASTSADQAARILAAQTFPHSTLKPSSPQALRPDDVDVAHPKSEVVYRCAARERAAHHLLEERMVEEARSQLGRAPSRLPGVGPAGVIPEASHEAFGAASYAPLLDGVGHDMAPAEGGGVDSAHEAFLPGQLPWYTFRSGSWLLAALWLLGALWSLAQLLQIPDIPDRVLPESVSISGLRVKAPQGLMGRRPPLPLLPPGRQIQVRWPNERFQPTGISCDRAGQHFAFSDEFQLFHATLKMVPAAPPPAVGHSFGHQEEKLRPELSLPQVAPPCAPLEGQAMQDVAVFCSAANSSSCKALVLHDDGRKLAGCSLRGHAGKVAPVWNIADKWLRERDELRTQEKVVSVAMNCKDNNQGDFGLGQSPRDGSVIADSQHLNSCVVVATDRDRVVKLRRHIQEDLELVPSGALWNARGVQPSQPSQPLVELTSSRLQILPGSYVLFLRNGMRTVHAVNIHDARTVGTWKLPDLSGRNWSGLAGSAQYLYVMSLSLLGEPVQLWQFPLPRELRA